MNILVVEDVKEQREALVKMIERNYLDSRIYSTDSVKKALEIAKEKDISLFLLDIELIDGSGMDLAKQLRSMKKYSLTGIVFITNNIIHIMEAFKGIHCYDFLVKPYNEADVKKIIDLFEGNNDVKEKEGEYIVVTVDGCVKTKIYSEDIIYIEYSNRNCRIKTKDKDILAKGFGLAKLLGEIKNQDIVQCHKAFAVNTRFIEKIVKIENKIWDIFFWNCSDNIPLGYKYKDIVMEKIN